MNKQTHKRIASLVGSQFQNPYYTPDQRSGFSSYLQGAKPHYAQQLELKPIGFGSYWEGRKPRYAQLLLKPIGFI